MGYLNSGVYMPRKDDVTTLQYNLRAPQSLLTYTSNHTLHVDVALCNRNHLLSLQLRVYNRNLPGVRHVAKLNVDECRLSFLKETW